MSIERDITRKAQKYLDNPEILLFIGARQAGKTTILRQLESFLKNRGDATYFLNLERLEYLDLLNQSPNNIFKIFTIDPKKKSFIFVDEIQYLKNPSNFLKYIYDEHWENVKLIVSGSSAFYLDKKFKDSLAGRKKIFFVPTLSFREFLRFKNENQLSVADFKNVGLADIERTSLYYREYMIYGGYPRVVLAPLEEKKELLSEIAFSYIKKDIYEANVRQEEIFYKLFKILAGQPGFLVNSSELANTLGVSKTSIDNYLYVMRKSFHVCLLKPFFKNTRKELTKMPKSYFYDLGLRNFFANDFRSFEDRNDKGILLENAAFRQLLEKYSGDSLRFWRTIQKHEIDFIIDEKEAFEVKVNPEKFNEKNYKVFFESYPQINLFIVSIDKEKKIIKQRAVINVWEI